VLVVDGAQSTPHIPVDVQALDADFFAFSGHKVYGPMGIGVLYGREELLNAMPPFLTGGEMIESVTRDGAVFAELPHKFEAGTVNAADAVGLHAAIDYVKSIGFTAMHQQEVALTRRAMDEIGEMPHVHVLGSEKPEEHCGIITFTVDGVHPHDISEILASDGVAIRAGHHCAQPLLAYLKHPSTARASLAFYNTESEVDRLLDSISTLRERMGYGKIEAFTIVITSPTTQPTHSGTVTNDDRTVAGPADRLRRRRTAVDRPTARGGPTTTFLRTYVVRSTVGTYVLRRYGRAGPVRSGTGPVRRPVRPGRTGRYRPGTDGTLDRRLIRST